MPTSRFSPVKDQQVFVVCDSAEVIAGDISAVLRALITSKGKRVHFYSTVDLVNVLEKEKRDGNAGRIALSLLRMDLVILDELGYLPFSQAGGALLYLSVKSNYPQTL